MKRNDEKYNLPKISGLTNQELFDTHGRNIQQYFFYNDEDGKTSYDNFLAQYPKKSERNIDETTHESYTIITSTPQNNKSITIYANKPEYDGSQNGKDGVSDIETIMQGQKPPLESIVIVHRGHSYHAVKTIERIPSIAKMVFLGSCGGFQNIGKVLEKSPQAHIISTKGTGTKYVNDPMFSYINKQILAGSDIVRKDVRANVEKTMSKQPKEVQDNFAKYVRPDQNLGAMIFKKYSELVQKE